MLTALSSKPATAVANGLAILTAIFAVISSLIPDWFGELTLPKALLVGLAMALVTLLISALLLAILAWAYRRFKPLPVAESEPAPESVAYDDTRIRRDIANLNQTVRSVIDDYQRMSGVEARLTDALDALKTQIQAEDAKTITHFYMLEEQLGRLVAAQSLEQDKFRDEVNSLYGALAAILDREKILKWGAEIEVGAKHLSTPTDEKARFSAEQWEEWERKETIWRSWLSRWLQTAECYRKGVQDAVFSTPESAYKGGWSISDDQFPTSKAVYSYQTFRIILKHWNDWRGEVERSLEQAAFNGQTRRTGPGTLGATLLEIANGSSDRKAVRSAFEGYDGGGGS